MVGTRSKSRGQEKQSEKNTKVAAYDPAPLTTGYEFGGPLGGLFISLTVPFFAYFCAISCTSEGCPPLPLGQYLANGFERSLTLDFWRSLWDPSAFVVYFAWYAWTVALWYLLPGKWVKGTVLRDGSRLDYKINGNFLLLLWSKARRSYDNVSKLFRRSSSLPLCFRLLRLYTESSRCFSSMIIGQASSRLP
jgi:hypothetical protein